jgi:DNA replication ATP-dependent helicase Dna2
MSRSNGPFLYIRRGSPCQILLVQVDRSNVMKTIHLRGDWVDTQVSPKSFVHVIGDFQPTGQCIVDNNQNILILHPDQLISATVVADSFTCMRRAVLQDRVKATSEASAPLVYGTILHEIFQEAMLANQWGNAFLDGLIVRITRKHVEDLYKIKVAMNDAHEHLRSKMTELRHWAAAFVSSQPKVRLLPPTTPAALYLTFVNSRTPLFRDATGTRQPCASASCSMSRNTCGRQCTD